MSKATFNLSKGKYVKFIDEITVLLKAQQTHKEIATHLGKKYKLKSPASVQNFVGKIHEQVFGKNKTAEENIPVTPVQVEIKDTLGKKIVDILKNKDSYNIVEIANRFDVGPASVQKAIQALKEVGYNYNISDDIIISSKSIPKSAPTFLNIKKMSTGFHKAGACGDNHLCSKYARLDVLNALYDQYERDGITQVFNTGNWIDGEARFNKHDLLVHGMDNQINYMIENYPQRKGITTYYVTGDDHEGWYTQREGIDIGKYLEIKAKEAGREDLVHLSYMEGDVEFESSNGKTILRVVHPGGGSAYATSYTMQKLVESYQGGEKPHIVAAGHYHKAEYLYYRGVHIIQSATTCDQTPFMRKLKLSAHLGGWEIEFATDDNGAITRFRTEFFPFYDNSYYKPWIHK